MGDPLQDGMPPKRLPAAKPLPEVPLHRHSLVAPGSELGTSTGEEEGGFLMEDQDGNRLELGAKQKLLLEQEIPDALR